MNKKTVAVLFGGQSSEHDVSCMSAPNVIDHIDRNIYDILLVGITKEGKWLLADSVEDIRSGAWRASKTQAVISPDATHQGVLLMKENEVTLQKVDVAFPVLHGLWGEDGTVQCVLELAKIPYVGCGVLASAVSMDKVFTKVIVDAIGIKQAKYVLVTAQDLDSIEDALDRVERSLPYPVFVKPSCAGSSKGVNKAEDRESLAEALREAAKHDRKILVEETIVGREIECAVLGGSTIQASGLGEILAAAEFYDFEAKYFNAESQTVLDPMLPDGVREKVRSAAIKIFKGVDGFGLSRVDFFVQEDGEVIFNEINTLPGFTAISMYPSLWERAGVGRDELIRTLLELAFERKNAYNAYTGE